MWFDLARMQTSAWIERVPTDVNVADDPSRLSSHRVIASLLAFARALTLQGRL